MPQAPGRILDPQKRVRTFKEARLGLSRGEAIENARIFLERERVAKGAPCPLGTDHFAVLRLLVKGDLPAAYAELLSANPFPGVTGRLCAEPYEETRVYNRKGERISVRAIEAFLADHARVKVMDDPAARSRSKVAVIGSGPAGLSAAFSLLKEGHAVTVFEASHIPGGILGYAYGEFRLPSRVLERAVAQLEAAGVTFITSCLFGRVETFEGLWEKGFSAAIVATGMGPVRPTGIPGEDAAGVLTADEFMKRVRWMKAGQDAFTTPLSLGVKTIVIGADEMALDCARTIVRMQRQVTVIVQGAESELQVSADLVRQAFEEGVKLKTLTRPVRVLTDNAGCVQGLVCHHSEYRRDTSGRMRLVEEGDPAFTCEAETIIAAGNREPNTLFLKDIAGISLRPDGSVVVAAKDGEAPLARVFTAGHIRDTSLGLMDAVLSGRKAAEDADRYLNV